MNSLDWLGTFWQDLQYGLRTLAQSHGFTLVCLWKDGEVPREGPSLQPSLTYVV